MCGIRAQAEYGRHPFQGQPSWGCLKRVKEGFHIWGQPDVEIQSPNGARQSGMRFQSLRGVVKASS